MISIKKTDFLILTLLFISLFSVMKWDILSRVDKVELDISVEKDSIVRIASRNAIPFSSVKNVPAAAAIYTNTSGMTSFDFGDVIAPVLSLKLDKGNVYTIQSMVIHNKIFGFRKYSSTDLFSMIDKKSSQSKSKIVDGALKISTVDGGDSLIFKKSFRANSNFIYAYVLFYSIIILFIIKALDFRNIPAIKPLYEVSYRMPAIDGIRGLAAVLVLMEHTWPSAFLGSGRIGVFVFFILSGYLLAMPFIVNPRKLLSINGMLSYISQRLRRILPMYLVMVFLLFGFGDEQGLLTNHLLFIQAEGHLWTIPQELLFYAVLPVAMLILIYLGRIGNVITIVIFSALTIFLVFNKNSIPINLYGLGKSYPVFLAWFFLGMLVAYFKTYLHGQYFATKNIFITATGIFMIIALTIFSYYPFSEILFGEGSKPIPVMHEGWVGLVASLFVLLVAIGNSNFLTSILENKILRGIGIVGFSFYLIHPSIMDLVSGLNKYYFNADLHGFWLFTITGLVTWLISVITYSLIEYPFFKKKQRNIINS